MHEDELNITDLELAERRIRLLECELKKAEEKLAALEKAAENALPIPPPCFDIGEGDRKSMEALRLWRSSDGKNVIMIRTSAYSDPYDWGMALADIIRYACKSIESHGLTEGGVMMTLDGIMDRLTEGFENELESPTDEAKDLETDA